MPVGGHQDVDLPMAPGRPVGGVLRGDRLHRLDRWGRPRPLAGRLAPTMCRQMPVVGAARDADHCADFHHSQLNSRLPQGGLELLDLGLQLRLAGGRTGVLRLQPGSAALQEPPLPSTDTLLGHLELPGCVSRSDLPSQDRQHDPYLLLCRKHRWTTHHQLLVSGLNFARCRKIWRATKARRVPTAMRSHATKTARVGR